MEKFYCVKVSVLRLGGKEQVANYFYKSLERAKEHFDNYRNNRDYKVVENTERKLVVRNENWTEVTLRLTEFYFED